jgi:hypothetical protein
MTPAATRWPLTWPAGWARTPRAQRLRATFGTKQHGDYKRAMTPSPACDRLMRELELLKADLNRAILSTNLVVRLDGFPRSDQAEPADSGAAVYFRVGGKDRALACDKWLRVADNIAAIAAHVGVIRAVARYGVGTLEQAFAGYTALPPTAEDWAIVLMVSKDATREQIISAYRQLAALHHPDKGGRHEDMARITAARDRALERFT